MNSSFLRKLRKLLKNPKHFLLDSKYLSFIFMAKNNSFQEEEKPIIHSQLPVNTKDKVNKKLTYESFNLGHFKNDVRDKKISDLEAREILLSLWAIHPWKEKLVNAYVYFYELNEEYVDACRFIEKAIIKHPNSNELKMSYVNLLRKSGEYNISKTVDVLENILEKVPDHIAARYFLCQFLWESQGVSPYLYKHIQVIKGKYKSLSPVQKNFLCACLYEFGRYTDVNELYPSIRPELKRKYFTLEMYYQETFEDNSLRVQAYNELLSCQSNFENQIKNANKISIVGNGPTELNTGNGIQIDSASLVIRFNNFATGGRFSEDYGFKTDYWVKGGYFIDIQRKNTVDFKGVIQSGNNTLFRNSSFDDFLWDAKISDTDFLFIPSRVYYDLIKELGTSPSAGLAIIYWIYLIRGKIPKDWVFGFSFGNQENNRSEHYFSNNNIGKFYPHNWDREASILNRILM
ncbi:glycosyltransferase family 29 protein [Ignatzschineria sp. LJL83]